MCPLLEFGTVKGLAQDFGSDKRIQDMRYHEQAMRQARLEAENKAKMFADDFDYKNAMNDFDNPRVKAFAQTKIKEIGKFVNENQDWETNVMKRAQYKQLVNELKDNDDLRRGMSVDAEFKAMDDYIRDPKNYNLINTDEFKDMVKRRDNYKKYGNENGSEAALKEGVKAFSFRPPEEGIDWQSHAAKLAKDLEANIHEAGKFGPGSIHSYVSEENWDKFAERYIQANTKEKWAAEKDYNKYVQEHVSKGEKVLPFKHWFKDATKGFRKDTETDGSHWNPNSGRGNGGAIDKFYDYAENQGKPMLNETGEISGEGIGVFVPNFTDQKDYTDPVSGKRTVERATMNIGKEFLVYGNKQSDGTYPIKIVRSLAGSKRPAKLNKIVKLPNGGHYAEMVITVDAPHHVEGSMGSGIAQYQDIFDNEKGLVIDKSGAGARSVDYKDFDPSDNDVNPAFKSKVFIDETGKNISITGYVPVNITEAAWTEYNKARGGTANATKVEIDKKNKRERGGPTPASDLRDRYKY